MRACVCVCVCVCVCARVCACVHVHCHYLSPLFLQCVVIGLHSTGEARTLEQLERAGGELTEFVSTAK